MPSPPGKQLAQVSHRFVAAFNTARPVSAPIDPNHRFAGKFLQHARVKTMGTIRFSAARWLRLMAAFALFMLPLAPHIAAAQMPHSATQTVHTSGHCVELEMQKGRTNAPAPGCCKDFCAACLGLLPVCDVNLTHLALLSETVPDCIRAPFPVLAPRTGPPRLFV